MQSKDRLRDCAERPFLKPELKGRGQLGLPEFRVAVCELLHELQIPAPTDVQLAQLFEKHRSRGSAAAPDGGHLGGVGFEEYEALIFRLLSFMLASGEVTVEPECVVPGEERDKHWREEFLKKNPQRFGDVYELGRKLGEGSFGAVYEVFHRSSPGLVRVCKVIGKSSADRAKTPHERVREEFAVLKRLDHPHVVRIFEDFEDELYFYLVMEPCWGGDLQDAIQRPFTEDRVLWEWWVCKVMQHTLSAVAYCHSNGVIHKDLKPENVMMSSVRDAPVQDTHTVVVDFGLAQMFTGDAERGHEIAGTPPFMAPEVWAGNFSRNCDIWSCGVMLFYMLSGSYPFMASRVEDFPKAVAREPDWRLISQASPEAQYICWRMLSKVEEGRPTAQALLRDAWFTRHGLGCWPGHDVVGVGLGLMQVTERSRFERFVARIVATQLGVGQLTLVNEAFRAFDADNDGALSLEELQRGLSMLGASEEEAKQVAGDLDVGRTGQVSYTEFLAGVMDLRRPGPCEQDRLLWLAWQQFSPDEQGLVRTGDIQAALAARGMAVAELPRSFLKELRRGASGTMTFEGFKRLVSQSTEV